MESVFGGSRITFSRIERARVRVEGGGGEGEGLLKMVTMTTRMAETGSE